MRSGLASLHARCAPKCSVRVGFSQRHSVRQPIITQRIVKASATYYDVLGVDASASGYEIKTAFRRQAKLVHPDVSNSTDSEEDFKRLKEAYDTLSDERQRVQYDMMLQRARRQRSAKTASTSRGAAGRSGSGRRGAGLGGGRVNRVIIMAQDGSPWGEFVVDMEEDDDDEKEEEDLQGSMFDSIFGEEHEDDSDDSDEDEEVLAEETAYMAWAAANHNVRSSFQSSWQANGKKRQQQQERGRQDQSPRVGLLTQEDKDLLFREMPMTLRAAAQQVFGARLQSLETLEELADVIEAVSEIASMGIEFDLGQGDDDGDDGGWRRGGGGGGSGSRGQATRGSSSSASSSRRPSSGGGSGGGGRSQRPGERRRRR